MATLVDLVGGSEYPGRGLAIGRDSDGAPFVAYWLTGRSAASQQRQLVVSEREVVVQDVGGGASDELRHYTAAIRDEDWVIVGNGTHVSELAGTHADCVDLQVALRNIDYEPDPPIRTPRIVGGAVIEGPELLDLVVGSARSYSADQVQHPSLFLRRSEEATAGVVTTYSGSADQVVTDGYPVVVSVEAEWETLPDLLWDRLNPALRVALVVIPLLTDTFEDAIARAR
ncbi:IMP cyclohydrolase [Kribbella catacumbae]|uniref:IMP cyclohydrolase n=1 Tax=Kribbella catacumbae TaxID=460086 RepID=UPI0003A6861D|nr:IMP cyclohydrolase [Kribbella catacumbae]